MRLLTWNSQGNLTLTSDMLVDETPDYAILSHTWGPDGDEVAFTDIQQRRGQDKAGYRKIQFCGEQARRDGIDHFWVDTCCIDKTNHVELSEAIVSMFRWYRDAKKCYVYLSDVSCSGSRSAWESRLRTSRWFTRGWTLQELLAPTVVEFFSCERDFLGTKQTLTQLIHEVTTIPLDALRGTPLAQFSIAEKIRWREKRHTKRKEDQAYCLLGIFNVFMPLMYGEGDHAIRRLQNEINTQFGSDVAGRLVVVDEVGSDMKDRIRHPNQCSEHKSTPIKEEEFRVLLDSLLFDRIDFRVNNVNKAFTSTCRWLFRHPNFQKWYGSSGSDQNSGFLWIKGKPGCGKSTLMKAAVEWVRRQLSKDHGRQIIVPYFFNARALASLEKSSLGLYRTVVRRLLSSCSSLRTLFAQSFAFKDPGQSGENWTTEELQDFLYDAVKSNDSFRLCLFIDALDEAEYEDDAREMIIFLTQLSDRALATDGSCRVRICLSSRHYPHISIGRGLSLVVEDQVEHDRDIELYITKNLTCFNALSRDDLRAEILNRSHHIFLWVVLIVGIMNRMDDSGAPLSVMKARLDSIPQDLDGLFREILSKGDHEVETSVFFFQWILFCMRPLEPAELFVAIEYSRSLHDSTWVLPIEFSVPSPDRLTRFILNCSRGLVEIVEVNQVARVQFIHETVRHFLLQQRGLASMVPALAANQAGISHEILRTACLRCISTHSIPTEYAPYCKEGHKNNASWERFVSGVRRKLPFLDYAISYLLDHAEQAQRHDISQQGFLEQQIDANGLWLDLYRQWWNVLERYKSRKVRSDVTLAYFVAERQHSSLLPVLLDLSHTVNVICGRYGSVLQLESYLGVLDIVQMLLVKGADVNARGGEYGTALQAASANGHEKVVQMLLDTGANVNAQGGRYGNALYAASTRGHTKVVQMLLWRGASDTLLKVSDRGLANEMLMPTMPPPTISLAADSGYATRSARSIRSEKELNADITPYHLGVAPSIILEDDAASIYSDDSTVSSQQDELVQIFGEQLANDLANRNSHAEWIGTSFGELEHTLADFSLRLGCEDTTIAARGAVKFVHKNRRKLAMSFKACIEASGLSIGATSEDHAGSVRNSDNAAAQRITYSESEVEESIRAPDNPLSVSEKMDMWRRKTVDDERINFGPSTTLSDATMLPVAFKRYYGLVSGTSSYRWLQSTLRRTLHVCDTDAALMQSIKDTILNSFPYPLKIGKQVAIPSSSAIFIVEWPLQAFIRTLKLSDSDLGLFEALTITGTVRDSQALSCTAYFEQIWPDNGKALLDLISEVLKTGREQTYTRKDKTRLTVAEDGGHIKVKVQGSRGAVAEVGQQTCWLGAALRPSRIQTGITLCYPQIRRMDSYQRAVSNAIRGRQIVAQIDTPMDQPVEFDISFRLAPIASETGKRDDRRDGTCWLEMFHAAVVACGFPIAGHRQEQHGLEMSLDVMAALMGTEFADHFDRKLFIKGHSSMLVSSQALDGLIMWHHCQKKSGAYISYFDHDVQLSQSLEICHLSRSRHIIGWCEDADFNVGAAKLVQQVQWSGLKPEQHTRSLLLGDCHLSFPARIAKGSTHVISTEQQSSRVMADTYDTIFRTLRGSFVLLWDSEGKRGWLVNALSALLHLMRNSLQIDKDSLGRLFVLRPEDLQEPTPGALAARDFLSNVHNLRAKVSVSRVSSEAPDEHEILETRMVLFYHVLRQAFDLQKERLDRCHRPWKQLEGWEFRSLAHRKASSVRTIRIPLEAKGWAELLRATGAITLLGKEFGELIHPSSQNTPYCAYWQKLPTARFYIAISTADLVEVAEAHELDVTDQSGELAPKVIWHKPPKSQNSGSCDDHSCMTSGFVQVLVPEGKHSDTLPPSQRLEIGKFKHGAFVFGHNEDLNWQWDDEDPIESPDIMRFDNASVSKLGELSKDSGYDSIDIATDVLSTTTSNQSCSNQLNQSLPAASLRGQGVSDASRRIYARSSFKGGSPFLGDVMGNRYENCQFVLTATGHQRQYNLNASQNSPALPTEGILDPILSSTDNSPQNNSLANQFLDPISNSHDPNEPPSQKRRKLKKI